MPCPPAAAHRAGDSERKAGLGETIAQEMDRSSYLSLFPLLAPEVAGEHARLKSGPTMSLADLLRAKSIASSAFLSFLPTGDSRTVEAFGKAIAVFSTLLFVPCNDQIQLDSILENSDKASITQLGNLNKAVGSDMSLAAPRM